MLEQANIPFEFEDDFYGEKKRNGSSANPRYYPAYCLRTFKDGKQLCDAIEHWGSYGQEQDLLEIMGGLTMKENRDGGVLGWLSAAEVFKRFKYCYEHNTSEYFIDEPPVEIGDLIRRIDGGVFEIVELNHNHERIPTRYVSQPAQYYHNPNEVMEVYRHNGTDYELIWKRPSEDN